MSILQHQPQTIIIKDPKLKKQHKFFFWLNFGQSITGHKKYSEIKQGVHVLSDVALGSDEALGIFTLQQCWDSWMSAMNNTETPGITIVKYKHIANRSNTKYQCWDANVLQDFSKIASLIKMQCSEQCRRQMEQNYKKRVQNKLNRMYGVIKHTQCENIESYIAYNYLSSDENEPISIVQNQSTNANCNITTCNNEVDVVNVICQM